MTLKLLMLAALAVLSLRLGSAMAQESTPFERGTMRSYETMQLNKALVRQAAPTPAPAATASNSAPHYDSSGRSNVYNWWGLAGSDRNGR
jgi:hypothetical protein